MVMTQTIRKPASEPRRIGVAEAKSRLSEVLRDAGKGPTIIHSRGRDLAVVLDMEEYARLTARDVKGGGAAFLDRVEVLKTRSGGGVDSWEPPRVKYEPEPAFVHEPRKRS
jgi:prevent-host-death family protein